eukprot:TRINITY_DN4745_c0_g1_i2.p2 TRINITY_DN4745_c0_g1~~TRINITY_DN4745_c0_g1_i2.p2  ORF type:complete len:278 (-),score=35.02 TRINITY_DN4745_c0_g1_i2:1390-2223(-)
MGGRQAKAHSPPLDQSGLLYALATNSGKKNYENPYFLRDSNKQPVVSMDWSDDAANYYSSCTGHQVGNAESAATVILENVHRGNNATMWSRGAPSAWFQINLHGGRKIRLERYVYRGDAGGGNNHPRTWELLASCPEEGRNTWVSLKRHENDNTVNMERAGSWTVEKGRNQFFSRFRIQNRGSPNHLCCSGIEFYGELSLPNLNGESNDLDPTMPPEKSAQAAKALGFYGRQVVQGVVVPEMKASWRANPKGRWRPRFHREQLQWESRTRAGRPSAV